MHRIIASFFDHDEQDLAVRATVTGTAANDMLLHALVRHNGGDSMGAVLCSESAHCFTDELALGGGVKFIPIMACDSHAKLKPDEVSSALDRYSQVMFGGIQVAFITLHPITSPP